MKGTRAPRGVPVRALHLPHIGTLAWSLLGAGSIIDLAGSAAIVLSTRRRRTA